MPETAAGKIFFSTFFFIIFEGEGSMVAEHCCTLPTVVTENNLNKVFTYVPCPNRVEPVRVLRTYRPV
jgi:hypothetical protein